MKPQLFPRPNLKLFFLSALIIAALTHWFDSTSSADPGAILPARQDRLPTLIEKALEDPSAHRYVMISELFYRQGDLKRAMYYLRKGALAAEIEQDQ